MKTLLMTLSHSSLIVMNVFIVLILLTTAQENHGLQSSKVVAEAEEYKPGNVTKPALEHKRAKRYATHLNPLLSSFDFYNNDGMNDTN